MKTTCLYCEKEYDTKRESSAYCSNSCRTGAYKLRKKNAQKEADRQIAAKAQKEKDDQQKLIEAELRIQNAAKRKKAKEDKAIATSRKNEKIVYESSQVETEIPAHKLTPNELPKQLTKHETKEEPKKHFSSFEARRRLDAARRPKSDFWDVLVKVVKVYNNYNKNKK